MSEENVAPVGVASQEEQTGNPAPVKSGEESHSQNAEPSAQSKLNAAMAKLRKENAQQQRELAALKAKSNPDGEDFKAKYSELNDKYTKITSELGRSKIENKLSALGVIKPALAAKLLDGIKVEDGELVTDDGSDPDDYIRSFIAENPYLLKERQTTGLGSKAPSIKTEKQVNPADIGKMSAAEFAEFQKTVGIQTNKQTAFGPR